MNLFRFLGDMSHILSFVILLHKIVKGKSAAGISLRTQEMYLGAYIPLAPRPPPLPAGACRSRSRVPARSRLVAPPPVGFR